MLKQKQITLLELNKNGLELVLNHIVLSNSTSIEIGSDRYVFDPYEHTASIVSNDTDIKHLSKVLGMEDIHYIADIDTFKVFLNNHDPVVICHIHGRRFLHHLEKEFSVIFVVTDTEEASSGLEYFCGELGDQMINIPYLHMGNTDIIDIISTACVYNN